MTDRVRRWARVPFWERVDRSAGDAGCWPWRGAFQSAGYGLLSGKLAHRLAYEQAVGPIPDGLTIDHLCRNRRCCNPSHMEVVTLEENSRRGEQCREKRSGGRYLAKRTHCKHGHEFTPENTRMQKSARICRACAKYRLEQFKIRRRQAGC